MDSKYGKFPVFDGTDYSVWKNKMSNFIKGTDFECWKIIRTGPLAITKPKMDKDSTSEEVVEKHEDEYDEDDYKKAEKNAKAMSLLQRGISPNEYSRFSSCATAKAIWDSLELTYEGTSQVKKFRISLLMQQYEMFSMNKDESINSMSARFSNITNELENLGKKCQTEDKVRKILRSLDDRWQSKVTAIEEAKDLSVLSFQDLIGSLMAHELSLNRPRYSESKNKGIALKVSSHDSDDDGIDEGMGLFVKRFNNAFNMKPPAPQSSKNPKRFKPKSKTKGCFKCGGFDHMIKDCPTWKNIKSKEKRERTKNDYKQAMLASCGWGDLEFDSDEVADEEEIEEEAKMCFIEKSAGTKSSKIDMCFMERPEIDCKLCGSYFHVKGILW